MSTSFLNQTKIIHELTNVQRMIIVLSIIVFNGVRKKNKTELCQVIYIFFLLLFKVSAIITCIKNQNELKKPFSFAARNKLNRILKQKSQITHPTTKIPLTRALAASVCRRQPCRNCSLSLGSTPICILTTKNFLNPSGNIHINLKSIAITLETHLLLYVILPERLEWIDIL